MKKELFGLLVIAVIFVTGCATVQEETLDVVKVTDFASCVATGNPVMESYPEQCAHDGQTFVNPEQVIPVEPDGGIGDGAGPLPLINECTEPRPEFCTREYVPVCGDDGETYGNKCTACSNLNVTSYEEGECFIEEPVMCTMQYDPVCGSDGKTYGNACQAGAAKVEVISNGECGSEDQPEVNICTDEEKAADICTMEYGPVCGSDGKIYGNGCIACSAKVESWVVGEC